MKTNKARVMISSPTESSKTQFWRYEVHLEIRMGHRASAIWVWGGYELAVFDL